MIKHLAYLLVFALVANASGQNTQLIKPGEKAPPFVLNRGENAIQGFTMPYLNKIVMLHFWSSSNPNAGTNNRFLNSIAENYFESDFINAEGFEIISIAVQSDQKSWEETIQNDSLVNFVHGIAMKGFAKDDVCLKFGVNQTPTDIVIDETGQVVLINPRLADLENYLDSKKNVHPLKKDIFGMLALSSSKEDKVRFSKVYLFNHYGDSLGYSRTNENGVFVFHDMKINHNYLLKIDNQMDIITSDPTALYNSEGELLVKGKTMNGGFVFYLPSKLITKLQLADSSLNTVSPLEITITKYLSFKNNNTALSSKDEQELNGILTTLKKNNQSILEIAVHSNSKQDEKTSKTFSDQQAQLLKTYFLSKGIPQSRLRVQSFGSSQPAISCSPGCTDEEHKKNKRVEFTILKN
ncbi:MAG: OmpA family protein [Bacteroidia bacterium]|nr:OmpA family protein [Bacteroidia bacterium]